MTKYRVYLEAVSSVSIEVEADSEDDAIDLAMDEAPSPLYGEPDRGDWYFVPDERALHPWEKREDYIEAVSCD